MRCLGIPNTAHFANITSIEDALALWNKIKNSKDDERWKPDTEVCCFFLLEFVFSFLNYIVYF